MHACMYECKYVCVYVMCVYVRNVHIYFYICMYLFQLSKFLVQNEFPVAWS